MKLACRCKLQSESSVMLIGPECGGEGGAATYKRLGASLALPTGVLQPTRATQFFNYTNALET